MYAIRSYYVLPSNREINEKRIKNFKEKISQTINTEDVSGFTDLVETVAREQDISVSQVAAALAKMLQGNTPMLLEKTGDRPAVKMTGATNRVV